MIENADDIDDEDLTSKSDDKNKWLLLLLLKKFDFDEKLRPVFTKMLNNYSSHFFDQAVKEIKQLGEFDVTTEQRKEIIDSIVADRVAFLLPEIEQATKNMITTNIATVKDVSALKGAITEAYAVSDERAATIAEIEYRTIENMIRIGTAKASEIVAGVLVSDGLDFDGPCVEADGQIWSLSYAGGNILQHPRCVREFTFLNAEEVEERGGIDVE